MRRLVGVVRLGTFGVPPRQGRTSLWEAHQPLTLRAPLRVFGHAAGGHLGRGPGPGRRDEYRDDAVPRLARPDREATHADPASSAPTPLTDHAYLGTTTEPTLPSTHTQDLRGIVSTLAPAFDRALLIRGTLDMLGMHDVPVGIGSDGGCIDHQKDKIEAAYIPPRFSEGALALEPGRELLRRYIYIHYIYIYKYIYR